MRRALFFIVAIFFAATSFASIPRVSALDGASLRAPMLDRASEDASAAAETLSETRVWASEILAPWERQPASGLSRALHQAYADSSTTDASGLRCFLSVDPYLDLKKAIRQPQNWNRYSYVMNNPINRIDPDGRDDLHVGEDFAIAGAGGPCGGAAADCANLERFETGLKVGMTASLAIPALAAAPEVVFSASLHLMRNPGTVLAAMKLLDSMGGNVSGRINPAGQTGGKLGFLLGNVASEKSIGRGGFFAGVMGFTSKTLDGAIRSHFADNFKNGVLQKDGRLAVTGAMTGANGVVATVKTVWQWNKEKEVWDLITSVPTR